MRKRLTATNVHSLPAPKVGQVEIFDDVLSGFALRISAGGTRSFVLLYRVEVVEAGERKRKLRRWTLGRLTDQFGLGEARDLARTGLHRIEHEGADPAKEKTAPEPEAAPTFKTVAADFIEKYAKVNNRSWRETERIFRFYCPDWQDRPITDIRRRDVHDVLDKLVAEGKGIMANRVRAALSKLFRWSVSRDYVEINPVEGVERPAKERVRDRVFTDNELKAIWNAADEVGKGRGAIVKILTLTGQRLSEVAGMTWREIDGSLWTLDATRTKASRKHLVPLSPLALRIVKAQPTVKGCDLIFPGRHHGKPMSGWNTLQRAIQEKSGVGDFSFHPLRRTLITGLAALGFPPHVQSAVANHAPQGVTAQHYNQHDYMAEKTEALAAWENHVKSAIWPDGIEALHG